MHFVTNNNESLIEHETLSFLNLLDDNVFILKLLNPGYIDHKLHFVIMFCDLCWSLFAYGASSKRDQFMYLICFPNSAFCN